MYVASIWAVGSWYPQTDFFYPNLFLVVRPSVCPLSGMQSTGAMKSLPTGKAPVRSHDFLPPDIGPICYHMLCASWLDLLPAIVRLMARSAPSDCAPYGPICAQRLCALWPDLFSCSHFIFQISPYACPSMPHLDLVCTTERHGNREVEGKARNTASAQTRRDERN